MTAARRTLSTALRKARFASGVLPSCYTTFRDTTLSACSNTKYLQRPTPSPPQNAPGLQGIGNADVA
jgi:hypothetical protein